MPVFRGGKGLAPSWCEMDSFEIVALSRGETHAFDRDGEKEKIIVGKGACVVRYGSNVVEAATGANLDLTSPSERFAITDVAEDTVVIRMRGRWGDETGGSGLFGAVTSANPSNGGDPVDYPKETNFDSHYHDCDEYWILFEGRGVAVSEGERYEVAAGDCVVTGMGHHHDFPIVYEPVKAVFFETTMEGAKRHGHLWNHKNGPAQPQTERV